MSHRPYYEILWSEGMLVGPQHFQQNDRYHKAMLDFRVSPLAAFGWGAIELSINSDLLKKSGIFQVEIFRGVLSSGTILDIPKGDKAPPGRKVLPEFFKSSSNRLAVYLALPLIQPNQPYVKESSLNGHADETRYNSGFADIPDETSMGNTQEIVTLTKNIKVFFEGEPHQNLEYIQIAELIKQDKNHIIPAPNYVPACMLLSASIQLQRILQNLHAEMLVKTKALSAALSQRTPEKYTLNDVDSDTVWALNILNGSIPILAHLHQIKQIHPQIVYQHLLSLAGQLSTLSVRMDVANLPHYDHENLGETFNLLGNIIQRLLDLVIQPVSSRYVTYEMISDITERGYQILRTQYEIDEWLLTPDHQFFLVIQAEAIEPIRQGELMRILPNALTIAGFPSIDEFVEFAYGVYVAETPSPNSPFQLPARQPRCLTSPIPPDDMPTKPGAIYCALEQEGPAWETIKETSMLAIYMPTEFRQAFKSITIELIIAKEAQDG